MNYSCHFISHIILTMIQSFIKCIFVMFLHASIASILNDLYAIKNVFVNISPFSEWLKVYVYVNFLIGTMMILYKMKIKKEKIVNFVLTTFLRCVIISLVYHRVYYSRYTALYTLLFIVYLSIEIYYECINHINHEKKEEEKKRISLQKNML